MVSQFVLQMFCLFIPTETGDGALDNTAPYHGRGAIRYIVVTLTVCSRGQGQSALETLLDRATSRGML